VPEFNVHAFDSLVRGRALRKRDPRREKNQSRIENVVAFLGGATSTRCAS
jgi:hypothetical protein